MNDGLVAHCADCEPTDGGIPLGEWLRFCVERVLQLYGEVRDGKLSAVTPDVRGASRPVVGAMPARTRVQEPRLFDFKRTGADTVISRF